jgi:hypothetical protein
VQYLFHFILEVGVLSQEDSDVLAQDIKRKSTRNLSDDGGVEGKHNLLKKKKYSDSITAKL